MANEWYLLDGQCMDRAKALMTSWPVEMSLNCFVEWENKVTWVWCLLYHTHMHACTQAYIHIYIHTWVHTHCKWSLTHACTTTPHTHKHTHTYTHTHMHTRLYFWDKLCHSLWWLADIIFNCYKSNSLC